MFAASFAAVVPLFIARPIYLPVPEPGHRSYWVTGHSYNLALPVPS